jgi:hypothetical protein
MSTCMQPFATCATTPTKCMTTKSCKTHPSILLFQLWVPAVLPAPAPCRTISPRQLRVRAPLAAGWLAQATGLDSENSMLLLGCFRLAISSLARTAAFTRSGTNVINAWWSIPLKHESAPLLSAVSDSVAAVCYQPHAPPWRSTPFDPRIQGG